MTIGKALFSSKRGDWCTPRSIFDPLHREFGFELDAAANVDNALCDQFLTAGVDALTQAWAPAKVWLNPPYGRDVGKWVAKARAEAAQGATVVCLLPARTDTRWFHEHVQGRAEVRFLRGRVKFVGATAGAPFPSMVVVFRPATAPKSKHAPKLRTYVEWGGVTLSVRSANLLDWNGVKDAAGLAALDLEAARRWRNSGPKAVEEMRRAQEELKRAAAVLLFSEEGT